MSPRRRLFSALLPCVLVLAACGSSKTQTVTTVTASSNTSNTSSAAAQAPVAAGSTGAAGALAQAQGTSTTTVPATTTGATGVTGVAGTVSTLPVGPAAGARPFADTSPWNTTVDNLPVDPSSAAFIAQAQLRPGFKETAQGQIVPTVRHLNQGLYINTRKWTDPVYTTQRGTDTRMICRQLPKNFLCGDGQNISSLSIPPGANPLPQYDGWFTLEDLANGVAYDMWRARRRADGSVMSYQFLRKWNLNGSGYLLPGNVSARGSGLPLFAGLITQQDLVSGQINHALAIALPGPARQLYVSPASTTDGQGETTSIPEGARIRLKPGTTLGKLPPRTDQRAAQAIYSALLHYGAIVVDRAKVPTLFAQLNVNFSAPLRAPDGTLLTGSGQPLPRNLVRLGNQGTPLLRGDEVQNLKVSDFEVVSEPNVRSVTSSSTGALAGTGAQSGVGGSG